MTFKMNWLAAHGYDVTLITYEQGDHPLTFELDPRIRHTDVGVKLWKKSGTNVITRSLSYLRLRRLFRRRVTEAVVASKPDVVVTLTDSYSVLDILQTIPVRARRIVESHVERGSIVKAGDFRGRTFLSAAARLYDRYMSRYVARADALVVLTEADARQWSDVPRVCVITNPLTVSPQRISDVSAPRAIAAGRLEDQKGFDLLIEAWREVHRREPQWQLHIYGNGPDRESLQRQIDEAGLTGVVTLHAATPDIFLRYAESSIYVLSSRYEGYGLVLAEAMSCGVPCVSFDCPYGPSDIIRNGEDGILVPHLDTAALAEGVLRLAGDDDLRRRMGEAARRNIQRFAPEAIMRQWQTLFEKKN